MTNSTPKSLLLDADAIIECYTVSAWDSLLQKAKVCASSIVVHNEAFFYVNGRLPRAIDLPQLVEQAKLHEVSADPIDIGRIDKELKRILPLKEIHEGEKEAIAIVAANPDRYSFISGDKAAVEALAALGYSENAISLARALKLIGIDKEMRHQFKDRYLNRYLESGSAIRIQSLSRR